MFAALNIFFESFRNFQVFAALNIFFLCFRLMKYVGEVSSTAFYSKDEHPLEEISFEVDEGLERCFVGRNSFRRTTANMFPAETAGVRPGWIVDSIDGVKFTTLLTQAKRRSARDQGPFLARTWLER